MFIRPRAQTRDLTFSLEWFGADPTGVADSTAAINTALLLGGVVDGNGGTYLVSNINMTVANTTLRNFNFIDKLNTTGAMFTVALAATGCVIEDFTITTSQSTSALSQAVLVRSDYCTIRRFTIEGKRWNMRLPYSSYTSCYPAAGIQCRKSADTMQFGIKVNDGNIIGGVTGLSAFNQEEGLYENLRVSYTASMGTNIGSGVSSRNTVFRNINSLGTGQYGITTAVPFGTGLASWPIPYDNLRIHDSHSENCGWLTYLTALNGGFTGGKGGFDIADGGNISLRFLDNTARNCANLGMEYKGAITTTLYPSGRKHGHIRFDSQSCYNNHTGLIAIADENDAVASSFMSNNTFEGNSYFYRPPSLATGLYYRPGDPVGDGTYTWVCTGDTNGLAGYAGATPLTGGHAAVLLESTVTAIAGDTVITFGGGTTGVVAGDLVFAGANSPDGNTVASVGATTVTLTSALTGTITAAANTFLFMATHTDGTLNWICREATPAAAGGTAIDIRASVNAVIRWNAYNCAYAWSVNSIDSVDGSVQQLSIDGVLRDCGYGLYIQGAGNVDMTLLAKDIIATVPITIVAGGTRSIKRDPVIAAPLTKTNNFTVGTYEDAFINNKAAATCTVTLPTASEWPGREITITNWQAFTVVSATSNVVPKAGGAAGTAIIAATAGLSAQLKSNGTSWLIVE